MAESAGPTFVSAWARLTGDGDSDVDSTYVYVQFADDSPPLTDSTDRRNFIVKAGGVEQITASATRILPLVYRVLLSETILAGTDVITIGYEPAFAPLVQDALGNSLGELADQPVTNYIGRRRYLWQHGAYPHAFIQITTQA